MSRNFFDFSDLIIETEVNNIPPEATPTTIFRSHLDTFHEFAHFFHALGTSQGIYSIFIRMHALIALSQFIKEKTSILKENIDIPFDSKMEQQIDYYVKTGWEWRISDDPSILIDSVPAIFYVLTKRFFDSQLCFLDPLAKGFAPFQVTKWNWKPGSACIIKYFCERTIPHLEMHYAEKVGDLRFGQYPIMEAYATALGYERTAESLLLHRGRAHMDSVLRLMWLVEKLDSVQEQNSVHFLPYAYVQRQLRLKGRLLRLILIPLSYLSLMHLDILDDPSVWIFKDMTMETFLSACQQFSTTKSPGFVFLEAVEVTAEILKETKSEIHLVKVLNEICDRLKIDRIEITLDKLRTFLEKIKGEMSERFQSYGFTKYFVELALEINKWHKEHIPLFMIGRYPVADILPPHLCQGHLKGNVSFEHGYLMRFANVLEQVLYSKYIYCLPRGKPMHLSDFPCKKFHSCMNKPLNYKHCHKLHRQTLESIIGDYTKIRPLV